MIYQQESSSLKELALLGVSALFAGLAGAVMLGFLVLLMSSVAEAAAESEAIPKASSYRDVANEVQRGSLLFITATGEILEDAPMVDTQVDMQISGMFARVTVKQVFSNPGTSWVEGIYVFPLPENAAVDRLRLQIGERFIEGEIQERGQAKKTYEAAKAEGRKASLLDQERANIFTAAVANIAPGESITIALEYQQELQFDQKNFRIRFPLVVAPRYIPGQVKDEAPIEEFLGTGWAVNTDQVPDASRITPPVLAVGEGKVNPVRINVSLDAGFALERVNSTYHAVLSENHGPGLYRIQLQGPVPAERDFELVWSPVLGQGPQGALFTEQWQNESYAMLMLMPPLQRGDNSSLPRELIFVVDTSGSMHGESMDQAKVALKMALRRLKPEERFNIIQFDSQTSSLFASAVAANPVKVQQALAYVDQLQADGGTEMLPALQLALSRQVPEGFISQIVFLTDGSVGNEAALFKKIEQGLGNSRLFTIGIGAVPNSFFMTRAARFGRGTFTYIGKVEEVREKMAELFLKLESPVLTDVSVNWAGGGTVEMWPKRVPDLYLGEPLTLAIQSSESIQELDITGQFNGEVWTRKLKLEGGADRAGVHTLWARRKIAQLMDQKAQGMEEETVRSNVLNVALKHQLVSRYTSLVAVDKTPVRPMSESLLSKPVPVNLPAGWSAQQVFGRLPQTATPASLYLLLGLFSLISAWFTRKFNLGIKA